ncbi:MAG TPA: phage holin family protein [Candidatus Paceibacterota bacterium]|nr:phage holin family protein [Candidatus Paceibacterota bacterium]
MHWLVKVVLITLGNAFALWLANRWVPGFAMNATFLQFVILGFILAILNFFLKPLLTLILGPIILITLGLGVLIVNAIVLYLLPIASSHIDFLHGTITIQSIPALFIATIVVSAVNFLIHILV